MMWGVNIATWTIEDLATELDRFEQEARAAGLAENTVRTYVDRSRIFVRWLAGEYQFQGQR
jgi:hypothetical protein